MNEQELIEQLQRGSERAFRVFVQTYQDRIYNLALRMLANASDAEDVAQEAFVSVVRGIRSFRGDSSLSTWLYRVAINHCHDRKRQRANPTYAGVPITEDGTPTPAAGSTEAGVVRVQPRPDALAERQQLRDVLRQELGRIDDEPRLMLILRDIQGLSYDEIATITDLPVGTVKSRLHRARMLLKQRLEARL